MMTDSRTLYSNHHAIVLNNIQKNSRAKLLLAYFYQVIR